MAMDTTPTQPALVDGTDQPDGTIRPPVRSRTVVVRLLLVGLIVWAFFALGPADAAGHALAPRVSGPDDRRLRRRLSGHRAANAVVVLRGGSRPPPC
jgi:hypothetical protein